MPPGENRTENESIGPPLIIGGRYKIIAPLAAGGMGSIFLVEDTRLGRRLALKQPLVGSVSSIDWSRFEREARAIARLEHPNVVKIIDMGLDEQRQPYFVMELLQGVSLAERLKRGPLSEQHSLEVLYQAASGLAAAHAQGIIHRDIKPGNIVLLEDGNGRPAIKIVDFGLAKIVRELAESSQNLTATGEVMGSPLYMSPQQCMGSTLDERTDIYSLGCVFFECLTGFPPFKGANSMATAWQHLHDSPPSLADKCGTDFSVELEQLVRSMLEKEPDKRIGSAQLLLKRIENWGTAGGALTTGAAGDYYPLPALSLSDETGSYNIGLNAGSIVQESGSKGHVFGYSRLKYIALSIGIVCLVAITYIARSDFDSAKRKTATPSEVANVLPGNLRAGNVDLPDTQSFFSELTESERIFHFPEKSMGIIGSEQDSAGRPVRRAASGDVRFGRNELLVFKPDASTNMNEILRRFRDDDLAAIDLAHLQGLGDGQIKSLSRLTGVRALELSYTDITDDSIDVLNQLPRLRRLNVSFTKCTGPGLSRLKSLHSLTQLSIGDMPLVSAALSVLGQGSAVDCFELTNCKLTYKDMVNVSRMSRLEDLTLRFNGLTDKSVEPLAALKNLKLLNLKDNNDLSPEIIDVLSQLPVLNRLNFSVSPLKWKSDSVERLKNSLPRNCELRIAGDSIDRKKVDDVRELF